MRDPVLWSVSGQLFLACTHVAPSPPPVSPSPGHGEAMTRFAPFRGTWAGLASGTGSGREALPRLADGADGTIHPLHGDVEG